jgi:hypothetical protein
MLKCKVLNTDTMTKAHPAPAGPGRYGEHFDSDMFVIPFFKRGVSGAVHRIDTTALPTACDSARRSLRSSVFIA